ncbi:hypothetical protein CYMTET_28470 [Cymbomonas tetramitiformis]|uniref:Uncharacterized protein n=1 Tax=Cymbomonas tetramitiformis TaxID=36881 RepID=A0AAE0FPB2_9CHLO|nr:hypothetical protein CYMTET_28470 [Cymbomonas tetramitiformis]
MARPLVPYCICDVAFSPRPYPNVLQRTASPQAYLEMGITTRSKISLTRDSDIDASLRLIDGLRNTPTAATPSVPTPNPASNEDADVAVIIRRYRQEQSKLVDEIYKTRLHRAWAKSIREDILGDKKHHFRGTDDAGLLSDLVEEHAALRYPANVDPQPVLAKEQRLVRDNRASDWTPTEATRKLSLYTRLDPVFYAAVKVRYPMAADLTQVSLVSLRSMVVEIYQAWAQTGGGKAASGADGISAHLSSSEYDALLQKITELKELVQRQHGEAAPVVRQQRERVQQRQQQQRGQQPRGFRVGTHKAPPVGFDCDDQRAKPFCGRCKKAGKGESYHFYRDCPLGGRQHRPTSAAAFCVPIDEEDAEGPRTGRPRCFVCAGAVGGIDVSAYGFTVEQQPASEGDDILRRLDDLAAEVHSAANPQVHYTHASFPPTAGIGQGASALVCGPAAAVATPEEQVPAGGAAASASAVPAPAMPVSQGEDVKPAPLQSARVTTTADADGEFAGFVQTVNHAAIGQVDLTGYDTDDYEDLADGSFVVKPRASTISANHSSTPAAPQPEHLTLVVLWGIGMTRRQGLYMAPVPWHPGPPPPAMLFEDGPPLSPASSSDDEAPPSGSTWQHPGAVQPPVIDESATPTPSNSLANDFPVTDTLHFGRPVLLRRTAVLRRATTVIDVVEAAVRPSPRQTADVEVQTAVVALSWQGGPRTWRPDCADSAEDLRQ